MALALDNMLNRIPNPYSFNPSTSIPDLSEKVIIITGGNAGLGLESAVQIAQHNPGRLYLTARSQSKYDTALSQIKERVPSADSFTRFVQMDLSSLKSVKTAADKLVGEVDRIDILMNNAGVMGATPSLTEDGYEVHFGTNHMGHALFTSILMPKILKTVEKFGDARIVDVSSGAYQMVDQTKGFDEDLVKTDMATFKGSNGNLFSRYGQSKLANILHAKSLAKHYPTVTSVAIHPGRVKTGLLDAMYQAGSNKLYGWFQTFYDITVGAHSVADGALTQLWAAVETDKTRLENGKMYFPVGKKDPGTKFSNDDDLAEKLWNFTQLELQAKGFLQKL